MSFISTKHFVDINIQKHVDTAAGTRDTAVLIFQESFAGNDKTITAYDSMFDTVNLNIKQYAKIYFENGGIKLRLIGNVALANLADTIAGLEDKYILVAYCESTTNTREAIQAKMAEIATARAADATVYGSNEKILLSRDDGTGDDSSIKNLVVKLSSTIGAEMTVAAYLSQIDVYGQDTVHDYAYTEEVEVGAETLTDAAFETAILTNYNVDIALAGAVRNCGGNCKDGAEITNTFVRIVLHQTLTEQLIGLLGEKLKNQTGVSKIYATIVKELDNYKSNGYLSTDKVWTDRPLVKNYNGVNYTIINTGDALLDGYVIKVLPLTALTPADAAAHKAPPIYIVIADTYAIRVISITGEVI